MPALTITIQQIDQDGNRYLAVTNRKNGQEICRNTFPFHPEHLVNLEPQWLLEKARPRSVADTMRGKDATEQATLTQMMQELAIYGQRLYGYLFGDGQKLAHFLEFAADPRVPIRLILSMHGNAAPLWRLPWEYVHDGRDFLALNGRFHLSRRPEGLGNIALDSVTVPLRILVIVSAPDDQELLDSEEEIGVIQDALDEALRAGLVQVAYVDDATLDNIGARMRDFQPHVVHYTGHGMYDRQRERSYLALEDEDGNTQRAGIEELRPHLSQVPDLRLVLLSSCQTAQTSDADAFRGVATGLLAAGIPAVIAMQFSIRDSSAIRLAGAFYGALARGETLTTAMQAARIALWQFADGPGYDWGIPALYLRTPPLPLVAADAAGAGMEASPPTSPAAMINVEGLPLPRHFVGRKSELRRLRRALRSNQTKAVLVRGLGGIGKSSVAARLIQRPGTPVDGVLTIRCHKVDPLDIPTKIASFLQGQGVAGHAEAGGLLLDSRRDPADRASMVAEQVAGRRYLFVFDNFETLLDTASGGDTSMSGEPEGNEAAYVVADPVLRGLLRGFLNANWRSLCIFTSRFRWRGFDDYVARATAEEIHLSQLTARQAIMMMDNLQRLRQEPIETKIAIWRKVGGHPKSIELLHGWLEQGRITDLLNDAALDRLLLPEWEAYFLRDLLAQIPAAEQEKLARLAIFQDELDAEVLAYASVTERMAARWLDLSLLQRVEQTQMLVHPVVAEYLLGHIGATARRELHCWAAAYYSQPFVAIAREIVAQSGQTWSETEIEELARSKGGVVGQLVHQTQNMKQAQGALARALTWQRHLFIAGEVDAANEIVNAIFSILARWGQRDQAKALQRRSIASLAGLTQAVAQTNLATLLMEEGSLDESLSTYWATYETFAYLDAKQQMAAVLKQMSIVYMKKDDLDAAIEKQETSLRIDEEIRNEEGQVASLHTLSILYRWKREYPTALARSQAAEELARKLGIEAFVASTLHAQGMIYDEMFRAADAAAEHDYPQIAAERFQQSLTISSRIGDEASAAKSVSQLGKLLRDAGQLSKAIGAFTKAMEIARKSNDPESLAVQFGLLGTVHEQQGEYTAALAKYQEALALFQKYGSPQNLAVVENDIARVRSKMEQ